MTVRVNHNWGKTALPIILYSDKLVVRFLNKKRWLQAWDEQVT